MQRVLKNVARENLFDDVTSEHRVVHTAIPWTVRVPSATHKHAEPGPRPTTAGIPSPVRVDTRIHPPLGRGGVVASTPARRSSSWINYYANCFLFFVCLLLMLFIRVISIKSY